MNWEIFKIYRGTFTEFDELGNEILTEQLYESVKGRKIPLRSEDFPMDNREVIKAYTKVALKGSYDVKVGDSIEVDSGLLDIIEVYKADRYTSIIAKKVDSL